MGNVVRRLGDLRRYPPMGKSNMDAPVSFAIRPIRFVFFTLVLLAIGWAAGYKMAIRNSTHALDDKIEKGLEHRFKHHEFNMHGIGAAMETNELVRKFRTQPKEAWAISCDDQIFLNTYRLSIFKTNDRLRPDGIEYELWKSLELLGIKSADEFQLRFKSSNMYNKFSSYFVERLDGQEHYSRLLLLVNNALRDADTHRELDELLKKRRNSGG